MITIRQEQIGDADGIRKINRRAFGGNAEADLVDRLRESCRDAISLVAQDAERLIGHILFTPVDIEASRQGLSGMGLAPMSVLPECQRQGVGSRLVESGLDLVRAAGHPFVVVLGHSEYYPRFGFVPASQYQIACEFDVPDDLFMILILDEDGLTNPSGVAKYHSAFDVWK